ncbi:hypothetical protein ACFSR7_04840 [Cohnella sp. GCM10020058]|uniref:hypothetical protein n=1 Tax=Cohnella sp. GCM10020058 TaxID=3317330 RepID=UPI003630651E
MSSNMMEASIKKSASQTIGETADKPQPGRAVRAAGDALRIALGVARKVQVLSGSAALDSQRARAV